MKPRPVFLIGALTVGTALLLAMAGAVLFLVGRGERTRYVIDDGSFEVIISSRRFESLIPRGPGSGSDVPGFVEIREVASGRSCGIAPIGMVWMATDLEWSLGSKPRTAVLVGSATWNLDDCTVDTSGW